MFNGTLARQFAGNAFRRADALRDERADRREHPVEAALRRYLKLRTVRRVSNADIDRLFSQVVVHRTRMADLADSDIANQVDVLQRSWGRAIPSDSQLAMLLALIGEGARRTLGFVPHPVQCIGAAMLMRGRITEMRTGEGKTLVAAIAATAMARSGCSVHVISTNDYLAKRDAEEMSPLYAFFGLTVGSIQDGMEPEDRRTQYRRSICYVSGKEVVFDYLKDRLQGHGFLPAGVELVRRVTESTAQIEPPLIPALHFAIVDEADSVLIDEARTPLIISREAEGAHERVLIEWAISQARKMREGDDYRIGDGRQVHLLPGAIERCEDPPVVGSRIWSMVRWKGMLLKQALTALNNFHRDQHYIIAEGKIQIVDESTGRVMADRSWEQGLHQLIECKEGLELTLGRETLVRMTFQRFFRRYFLVAGLTGTAAEAARELWGVYELDVLRIPPNKPLRRQQWPSRCFPNAALKWEGVADDVSSAVNRGQPVLVGTRSVEASEALAEVLVRRGISHVVLNARQDAEEADIIKAAGAKGRVTVATNMAGRGTDIKPDSDALASNGLHVILTEFHSSSRVDRQLFGRSGRQGNPGSARAIVAADDDLFFQYLPRVRSVLRLASGSIFERPLLLTCVRYAQWRAETQSRKARMQTLKHDQSLYRLLGFAGRTV